MKLSKSIRRFWTRFLQSTGRDPRTRIFDIFYFADTEAAGKALALLVISGRKTAAAALQWEYEVEGGRIPRVGDLSVVTTWDEEPLCVVETTAVDVRPFAEVDATFAAAEGEGDTTPGEWRRSNRPHFERVCVQIGKSCSDQMPVVCQRFKVVFEHRARAEAGR